MRAGSGADWLVLGLLAGSVLGVASTGHFLTHYLQQLLFPIALLAGAGSRPGLAALPKRAGAAFAGLALAALPLFASVNLIPVYFASEYDRIAYLQSDKREANRVVQAPEIGAFIARQLPEGSTIYNFGRESQLYYYARTQPPVPMFYDRPFVLDPGTLDATLAELRMDPPLFVIETLVGPLRPPEYVVFLEELYVRDTTFAFAVVYRLR